MVNKDAMSERRLLAEWWELQWKAPGRPTEIIHSGWPAHGLRPAGTFGSAKDARDYKKACVDNRRYRIVHVWRYATAKGAA